MNRYVSVRVIGSCLRLFILFDLFHDPLQHLLIETDAPYLTPHPHRGKTNHSGYLVHTAARIAEIRGISEEEVRDITRENALRFFGI